jgi:hypothetical protein
MNCRNSALMKAISDKPGPCRVTTFRARRGAEHSKEWNDETPSCSNVSRRLYRRLDPRLCARWWSRIWRLRARHDTLSVADPAGAGSKPDSSSTRVTLAGTHDQWATVTARIPRPDRNRGMTPSCSSGVSAACNSDELSWQLFPGLFQALQAHSGSSRSTIRQLPPVRIGKARSRSR